MPTFLAALEMVPPSSRTASDLSIGCNLSVLRSTVASALRSSGAAIPAMSTLRERTEEAIAAGFRPTALAKAAGISPSAVAQWRSGSTKSLSAQAALGLAALTGWSAQWWTTGRGPRNEGGPTPADVGVAHPLSFSLADDGPPLDWEAIVSNAELPSRFCCAVPDDALAPRTLRGTVFTFDRNAKPAPGLVVLVEDGTGTRYVRRYTQGAGHHWSATAADGYVSLDSITHGLRVLAVAVSRWDGAG